jgi:hypothetical protein
MTRDELAAIRVRLSGVFGPHGDGLAAAPSLSADVSALLEEVERLRTGIASVAQDIRKADEPGTAVWRDALSALLR